MNSHYDIMSQDLIDRNIEATQHIGGIVITPSGMSNGFPGIVHIQFFKAGEEKPVHYVHTNLCEAYVTAKNLFGKGKMVEYMASIGTHEKGANIASKDYKGNLVNIGFMTTTHNEEKAGKFVMIELVKLITLHKELADSLEAIGLDLTKPIMLDVVNMKESVYPNGLGFLV